MAAKSKLKSALYHQPETEPKRLYVNREWEDGTVDLVDESGKLVVGKCPVVKEPKPGNCSYADESKTVETTE